MNIEEIGKEIIDSNLDLEIDYAEIGLDEFFDDGILKEIPVVKTLVAVVKTGVAIKERYFIKKFLVFLREFHSGIAQNKLKEFKGKFETDQTFRNKITEEIILIVDRSDSVRKSRILAHLFNAHINGEYGWERFLALSRCLENLQEIVYDTLEICAKNNFANMNSGPTLTELQAALDPKTGNVDFNSHQKEQQALLMAAGIAFISGSFFSITSLGRDLYKYGISKTRERA